MIYGLGSAHEKFNEVAPRLKKAISELQKLSLPKSAKPSL